MHGMTDAPVREVPDEYIREYASSVKNMVRDPDDGGPDSPSSVQRTHDIFIERFDELRVEFRSRRGEGRFGSSDTLSSLGSARHYTFTGTKSESVHPTETGGNDPGSVSDSKRRLSSDEAKDEPNSKRVKTEKNEGSSGEGSSGQGSSNQGTSNENVGGNSSPLDYVLEKQSCEMPDISEADGGD